MTPLKKYERYKDSGVEWINRVPEHWGLKDLKYSVDLICKKASEEDFNKPYIGLEHVESKTGKLLNFETQDVEGDANLFRTNDVLFGKLRPYLAKCIVAKEYGQCSSEFLVLRQKCIT